ncbi:ATP-binding cassette domain-containing protein [Rhodococcus qingshengii]|uniref:ATP-binding cassette domain-containing protein n=1 Tax=Rhodococcus qingshengii TaxID=334542 RepID=UPI001E50ACBD|nr:sugar ABC transporter ATP-binding protein [Rhodococcus qingshengii]MCQ4150580.1 sugar ABC transporter ATP-binding protein [Rhodococcus qingshengii]UGQ55432.1 sugar ABC transporter ATP-binding protein [Rhodococcus qingshengii]
MSPAGEHRDAVSPRPGAGIRIQNLNKSFGANHVLKGIDLEFLPGQISGLMGANGAGKSTLIKILDGIYSADGGEIYVGSDKVRSLSGRTDVGFIHQDLGLVEDLSVADNLRLGRDPIRRAGVLIDRQAERRSAEIAIARVGLRCTVDAPLNTLSPGEKALVAVARVLDRGVTTLFVDESTSTLPPADAAMVISALTATARAGATVVMVTHKLSEILDATDRVVVLIDGVVAEDAKTADLDRAALVRMLLSHDRAGRTRQPFDGSKSDAVMTFDSVEAPNVGPLNLVLHAGEVIGLTGRPGSGLHEIAFLAARSMTPSKGKISTRPGTRTALVPPHRESQGGFPDLDIMTNMTIASLETFSTVGILHSTRERRSADWMVQRLSVNPPDAGAAYGVLSGGNKQKVIFGRALLRSPDVVILCEPTRGVDVGTRADIYALIDEIARAGATVLITTSDAEDLFAVCDRIGIVDRGIIEEPRPASELKMADLEEIV